MPAEFLTEEQQQRYAHFNSDLTEEELARYFHLDDNDRRLILGRRGDHNRLGFAVQLCTARYIGSFLEDLSEVPAAILSLLARQLDIELPGDFAEYGASRQRWDHTVEIRRHCGYREFSDPSVRFRLNRWLYALCWTGTDRPGALFDRSITWLVTHKILLPGITVLERHVGRLRARVQERIWASLIQGVSLSTRTKLDALLTTSDNAHESTLDRLRKGPFRRSAPELVRALRRVDEIRALALLIIVSMAPLLKFIGKDFLPSDDTGQYQITVKAPEGASLEAMKKLFSQIEAETKQIPFVVNTLSSIGTGAGGILGGAEAVNEGYIIVELKDLSERSMPMKEIMAASREMLAKYSNLRVSVNTYGGMGGGGERELEYVITGPDLDKLQLYSKAVVERLKKLKGAVDIDTSFSYAKPEYRVEINRRRAHALGVKVEDIATSLRTLVGGEEDITKYKDSDELYQVRLRAQAAYRDSKETIAAMMVPANGGKVVRLDNVADIKEGLGPTRIERHNRQRKITVEANTDGAPLGKLISSADAAFREVKAPPEYSAGPGGRAKELEKMLTSFLIVFLMAFIFIYIVLASQFESFVHPLSIMIVLPLTVPFALISLFVSDQGLTIFSLMGMFMLFGIVQKNSILQVDYTNTLRAKGMNRYDAMLQANKTRLRPILMTTLTLIAAMIPMALGAGAGSGSRRAMALVIIGGQALSLLITLLMTPVAYSLFDDAENWFRNKYMGQEKALRL
ncbi:MAG: efflux RND transporter permease subunit [Elusimicrobia bacterium]|nr:efflux RND transporter permease subunit [Elusimicrobiota bacterium]